MTGLPLLSSCGTILYPDRAHQAERGNLDPAIIILDGIGLFFFLVPGIIAFAVDFATGAIYFPADQEPGDRERTIFDRIDSQARLNQGAIERIAGRRAGQKVDLNRKDVLAMRLNDISDFDMARSQLS